MHCLRREACRCTTTVVPASTSISISHGATQNFPCTKVEGVNPAKFGQKGTKGLPLPQQQGEVSPQRHWKVTAAATPHRKTPPSRTLSTMQHDVCNLSTGVGSDGCGRGFQTPSVVAPGNRRSPTIGPVTKCTSECPADAWRLTQGTKSMRGFGRSQSSHRTISAAAATVGLKDAATSTTRGCRDKKK